MQIIEYPVSLVMKAWHAALTALGMDAVDAWPLTILLLVLTVRLILLPFAYRAQHSSRMLINLRPALAALDREYAGNKDPEAVKEKMNRRRALQREGGYRMRDGCIPSLIQIPVFLGLYRILLTVSRPTDLENAEHQSIGALNSTDVDQFLDAKVFGVPLPAYSVMTDERFTFLGTTSSEVFRVALPLCTIAAILTTLNMAYSVRRNWMTLDEDSALARGLFKFLIGMTPFVLLFPLFFGLAGPAPVAIMCYWVANNLWTVAQTVGLNLVMDRKAPYTEEFLSHRKDAAARRKQLKQAKKNGAVALPAPTTGSEAPDPDSEVPDADTGEAGRHRLDD